MKKCLISLLTLMLIISTSICSYAANTGGITLSVSKDTIKAGDEISVVVKASDSNNLNTVEYSAITITDESGNSSSAITVKSIETVGDNWAKMNNDGKTNFVYSGGAIQSSDVFKITFTVGDSVTAGTYTINVTGLKVYSTNIEDDTTDIGTKTVSVKAIVDDTTAGNQGGTQEPPKADSSTGTQGSSQGNTISSNSSSNSSSSNKSSNTNKSSSAKKNTTTKLPQTGVESFSVVAIFALGAIAIASYISYRKYKNI